MAQKYAKDQPSGFTNHIERVAIVGAGGSVGERITKELLKTGRHTVTALTRSDSKSKLPAGVKTVPVDYADEATLVAALRGQQFLIITMSVLAPRETHSKLVQAAATAGVPHVMPNCYGSDVANDALAREMPTAAHYRGDCAEIEATGVSAWTALVCGMWYEYSLVSGPEWLGFDFKERRLTLYDRGDTRINLSTWEQCGRAVAALLSLKELPEGEGDRSPTVSAWRNRPLYVSSFFINQRDMFESWKRVTGDTDAEWKIESEPTAERYKRGMALLQSGDRQGFGISSFTRLFFPNGDGDYEHSRGLDNTALGLPKEDLDERTRVAKHMIDTGYSYFGRG